MNSIMVNVLGKGIVGMQKATLNDINLEGTPFVDMEIDGKRTIQEIVEVVNGHTAYASGQIMLKLANGWMVVVKNKDITVKIITNISVTFHFSKEKTENAIADRKSYC